MHLSLDRSPIATDRHFHFGRRKLPAGQAMVGKTQPDDSPSLSDHEGGFNVLGKKEFLDIVAEEVNVTEVVFDSTLPSGEIVLDTAITPLLREKGELRDLIRLAQEARKHAGLVPGDSTSFSVSGSTAHLAAIKNGEAEFKKAVNARRVELKEGELKVEIAKRDK